MDLLASFQLEDLPEQQTRIVDLMKRLPDFDLALGFDACCTCGTSLPPSPLLKEDSKKIADKAVEFDCPNCHRVRYCSDDCRRQDANVTVSAELEEEAGGEDQRDTALGHSSVICAVLKLCNDDEAVEDELDGKGAPLQELDLKLKEAANDRIQSEKESYPATLANVIADGPTYQDVLQTAKMNAEKQLIIHVIGASIESEFWNDSTEQSPAWDAYAEALTELCDSKKLHVIKLIFIGPECPDSNLELSRSMKSSSSGQLLMIRSYKGPYNQQLLNQHGIPKPDVAVFFNPGFTVPDYDWREALAAIPKGTAFLSTTNSELEGIADCQYLLDQDRIQTMPDGLAHIFGLYSPDDEEDDNDDDDGNMNEEQSSGTSFFSVNPFSGSRVRQSGTMANDLYVKNRWMLGGILDSFDPSKAKSKDRPSKKKKRGAPPSNDKRSNPALI